MKVLITGIAGFVGSHLAEFLIQKKQKIYGTCLACEPLNNIAHIKKRINLTECDVTDFKSLKKLIHRIKPDRIYHLAAFSSVGESFARPLDVVEVNVRGTLYMLEILRKIKKRIRLLVISSSDVYGKVKTKDLPIKETHSLRPVSPYGASKACADLLAYQYFQSYRIPVIRTRSFNHTGPRQRLGFVVPDFASQIAKIDQGVSKPVMKVGNLSAKRDISDVRDVVRAYHLLMEKGRPGEAYNVCSGKAYRIETLLSTLLRFSTKDIKVSKKGKTRPAEIAILLGDNSKIEKEVGWKPRISIHKTLRDTFDYWKDMYSRG
ncbi:MAG: GDP-mannose 4,6-dehydratase [Candidatus Zixiibacteriota bacterium]